MNNDNFKRKKEVIEVMIAIMIIKNIVQIIMKTV